MNAAFSGLELSTPRDLAEALDLLDRQPLTPLAGCTDLYVALQAGTHDSRRFLDLWPLDELRGVSFADDRLRIGALTTHAELESSELVRREFPLLAAAATEIGGPQIRNRGTLGGNVVNGSPAGDLLPALAVGEADLLLVSAAGERRVAFGDFFTGYRQTVMRPNELLQAVELRPLAGRVWFRKVGTRAAQAISKVVLAAVREEAGFRIAFGSVAPTVVRCPRTESALRRSVEEAQEVLGDEIRPIDDLRSTADYRLLVARNLLARFARETAPDAR